VRAYEQHLNDFLRNSRHQPRSQIVDELRTDIGSFDTDLAGAIQTASTEMQQVAGDLQNASDTVLKATADLETKNSARVENDHAEARSLMHRAEWVLSIVSGFTILLSVWISFILPREVVQPLVSLKEAVDHAAGGNFGIEFDIQGEGEVVQLANSVRNLIAHVKEKLWT